jgi:hypothetical protein
VPDHIRHGGAIAQVKVPVVGLCDLQLHILDLAA